MKLFNPFPDKNIEEAFQKEIREDSVFYIRTVFLAGLAFLAILFFKDIFLFSIDYFRNMLIFYLFPLLFFILGFLMSFNRHFARYAGYFFLFFILSSLSLYFALFAIKDSSAMIYMVIMMITIFLGFLPVVPYTYLFLSGPLIVFAYYFIAIFIAGIYKGTILHLIFFIIVFTILVYVIRHKYDDLRR